jgi:predicted phosphodiesterase
MRYGIISDIHGNWEALKAVLRSCEEEGVRAFFCAGDVVGYGANPLECINELNNIRAQTVTGNHDQAVCGKLEMEELNPMAAQAACWTQDHLGKEARTWLHELPLVYTCEEFLMAHGSLNAPEKFIYIKDLDMARDTFYLMDKPLCFLGHTHVAQVIVQGKDKIAYLDSSSFEVDPRHKYVVNVGSVGQPRDGNPSAAYCIYDPDLNRVTIKRVAYDIKAAQARIIEAGLPEYLAQRLAVGQ